MKNAAIEIVKKIRQKGYEAYWAGGCVRDKLMGIQPKDFDIVTSATPDEIKQIIPKTLGVGKQFGVIIAKVGDYHFEIATFRSEGKYSDARRPDKVFWSNAQEDAKRRDFTINGLFYDPIDNKVIDYVEGQEDIKHRIIRFIGNPSDRIKEDNLRLLRAVRFKNNLNFKYEKRTWEAICQNAYRIESITCERIASELNKMFGNIHRANAIDDLSECGMLKFILPEIERLKGVRQPDIFHKEGDAYIHTLESVKSLPMGSPAFLIWAVLLHDAGKAQTISYPKSSNDRIRFNKHIKYSAGIAAKICRRLKFPNIERELIVWLVKNHMKIGDVPKLNIVNRRRLLMDHRFVWLLKVFKADIMGTKPRKFDLYDENVKLYEQVNKEFEIERKKPKHIPLISGYDLIQRFDLNPSPQFKKILISVEDAQLAGKIKTKAEALELVKKMIKK